jgi:hypothetical protein
MGNFVPFIKEKVNSMKARTALSLIFLIAITGHFAAGQVISVRSTGNNEKTVWNHSNGISNFNVEVRGKIELTDDDKDIKSISSDGYLEINKTVFGSRRTLIVTPQGNSLKREYYESRTSMPFEPEGRKWMNEILPELVRSTTIGAEGRVNRFFKQGGANAVLGEINRLESDYVKAHYANLLMGLNVPAKDYATIISRIADTIDSDYYLADFLQKNLTKFLSNKEATDAVFAACGKMDSDHYKTEVIKEALRNQSASPEAIRSILAASSKMESDHYKTEVLTTLMKQGNLTDATVSEMINASKSIESDYYRSVVLNRALAKAGLSATSYQRVLESVKDIDSDHYKTEVITNLLKNKLSSEQIQNLVNISTSINSDHYVTQVLDNVLKQDMTDEAFKNLIDRVSHIESDYYASTVLQQALNLPNLTTAKILSIINASANIGSDHYITEVLVDAAPKVKNGDASLKDAYRAAAKKIDSETYYGRVMKALEK